MATRGADTANPLISIVIPTFNGERYLAESIESVFAQSYSPVELIVVDDASSDGSVALARSYEAARVIERPVNGGVASARNDGLAIATGEYFGLIDQDDVMVPDRLVRQIDYLASHGDTDVVVGKEEVFVEEDGDPETGLMVNRVPDENGRFAVEAYYPPSLLMRTADLRRLGGFDTTIDFADDLDLLMRLLEDPSVSVALRDEVMVRRRFHGANQMRDRGRAKRAVARAFQRRIERARANSDRTPQAER